MSTTQAWPSALSEPQQIKQIQSVLSDLSWKCDIIKRLSLHGTHDDTDSDFTHIKKIWKEVEEAIASGKHESENVKTTEFIKTLFKEAHRLRIRPAAQEQNQEFQKTNSKEHEFHEMLKQLEHVADAKLTANVQDYGRLQLHDMLNKNNQTSIEQIEAEIEKYENQLKEISSKFTQESVKKQQETQRLEESIKTLQVTSIETLTKLTNKAKAKQDLLTAKHKETTQQTTHEIQTLQTQLDEHQRNFKIDEKSLRKKREKMEEELAAWQSRYANEVGEKQSEIEAWKALYGTELTLYNDISAKHADISQEWQKLEEEREQELKRQRALEEIERIRVRAAKIIQRAWRSYRSRNPSQGKQTGKQTGKKNKKIIQGIDLRTVNKAMTKDNCPQAPYGVAINALDMNGLTGCDACIHIKRKGAGTDSVKEYPVSTVRNLNHSGSAGLEPRLDHYGISFEWKILKVNAP